MELEISERWKYRKQIEDEKRTGERNVVIG
jgi:hypothetical protein